MLLKRLQENLTQNLQSLGFFHKVTGIDSKISVFRNLNISDNSIVEDNLVIGSQWFDVHFQSNAVIKSNKFTAVQFFDLAAVRSDFCLSKLSLTKLSNLTLNESRFEQNKLTRAKVSDSSMTESDFTGNIISKSDFCDLIIHASRLSRLIFTNTEIQTCKFESCDLQGIEFENCRFQECTFSKIQLAVKEPIKIANYDFHGKHIAHCRSTEEFFKALGYQ